MIARLTLAACLLVFGATVDINKRIINGNDAELGSFPSMASLHYKNGSNWQYFCGGVLVKPKWVLTTARCVKFTGYLNRLRGIQNTEIQVRLGGIHLDSRGAYEQRVMVVREYPHPNFRLCNNGGSKEGMLNCYINADQKYDIALLELASAVDISQSQGNIQIARISDPEQRDEDKSRSDCVTAGWGYPFNKDTARGRPEWDNTLQILPVTDLNFIMCDKVLQDLDITVRGVRMPWHVHQWHVCTRATNNVGTPCDMGGPLMCGNSERRVVGLQSFGDPLCSGSRQEPFIYTRISYYWPWIRSVAGSF